MVSVLIPTISNKYLPKLLPDLEKEVESVKGEIIITDNSSGLHPPYSFAKSNNLMAKEAKFNYLLLLNDDTQIKNGFLQKMIHTFDMLSSSHIVGVVGCQILSMQDQVLHAGVYFNKDKMPYEKKEIDYEIKKVPNVTAACMMVHKQVWEAVGGMNEEFQNGWEDNDFNLRVREKGYEIWYNGQVVIKHVLHGSNEHGRMKLENQNVELFKKIWITSGRIDKLL